MKRSNRLGLLHLSLVLAACAAAGAPAAHAQKITLPEGFEAIPITPALDEPVSIAFASDGRLFVAEKKGVVKVVQGGNVVSTFIDLRDEINAEGDRGLLGIALEPDYVNGRHIWLLLTVDPEYGEPDESSETSLFGRLLRYQGTAASGGNVAGANSRKVLLGNTAEDGFPDCWTSHAIGTVRANADGTVFVGAGDGARYEFADGGGVSLQCIFDGNIDPPQDLGAFRSQSLDSLAGKILRVDGVSGEGLPDNPFFTGNPQDRASKVWVYGVRNPFRFAVKPGTSPGTLFIGDVGWDSFEEVSVSSPDGGNNFGWPCFEGFNDAPDYPFMEPPVGGCGTIGTPENPGELTAPAISWSHNDPSQSIPEGIFGNTAVGGAFSAGTGYPVPYRNGFFIADFIWGWIKLAKFDGANQFTTLHDFADGANGPVDFAIDPLTGDLCYASLVDGLVYRIHYAYSPADVTRDGVVDIDDLFEVINGWGTCTPRGLDYCPSDVTDNGETDIDDLFDVINSWG